jgi:hypothetical protein
MEGNKAGPSQEAGETLKLSQPAPEGKHEECSARKNIAATRCPPPAYSDGASSHARGLFRSIVLPPCPRESAAEPRQTRDAARSGYPGEESLATLKRRLSPGGEYFLIVDDPARIKP